MKATYHFGDVAINLRKVWPRPFEKQIMKEKQLVGVEIGVFKGEHAVSMLRHLEIKKLYLVDPYNKDLYESDREDPAWKTLDKAQSKAYESLAMMQNKEWVHLTSEEAAQRFEDETLDFVYIDALHTKPSVLKDLELWVPKVKKGGLIGGHDWGHVGVTRAVCEYAEKHNIEFSAASPDWWWSK